MKPNSMKHCEGSEMREKVRSCSSSLESVYEAATIEHPRTMETVSDDAVRTSFKAIDSVR